jgi:cysteine-rich repeat protein
MTSHQKYLSLCLLMIAALLYGPFPALAQTPDTFAALAGQAVTCTTSTINGDVGVASPTGAVTCTTNTGTVYPPGDPAAQAAYAAFLAEYTTLATQPPCTDTTTLTAAPVLPLTLTPGVYCTAGALTLTGPGTLTLDGDCDDEWIFRIGTSGVGALTTTNLTVVHPGCNACDSNVTWWTAQGATLTTSTLIGRILAGADITVTGGALDGQAVAGGRGMAGTPTGAVTLTNAMVNACGTSSGPVCGNGEIEAPEECDDGNTVSGDGCSAQCREEDEPVSCSEFPCGNNGDKVEVCHIPPGNPRNAHTICISPNALDTHIQQHGDYCGPCKP